MSNTLLPILTKEEIMQRAPQVYTEAPLAGAVSSKYSFVPTYRIIEDMKKLGWEVCQAMTMNTKNANQRMYGKHMIKFYNPAIRIEGTNGQPEAYPQILIINNHRGWGKLRFEVGIFRLVCSNGLVIKAQDFGSFVMRHLGYSFEELQELMTNAVKILPSIVTRINTLDSTLMTPGQMKTFAIAALKLRMGKDVSPSDNEVAEILRSIRKEDEGTSVWKVYNRVQEKLIAGGFSLTSNSNKERKVRKITNMLKDVDLNQQLWELTQQTVGV